MIVGLYLLILCGVAYFSVHPFRTPLFISPAALQAPQESLVIPSTNGIQLQSWWVEADDSRSVAILCHGYVMNRSELTPVAYWLWQRGISSLLFEFRAHGSTRGGISTIGYHEADDVLAAIEEVRRRKPGAKILLIGSSMGAAACAFAASQTRVDGMVLDSCYSKLVSASFGWWRFLGGPLLSWVLGPTVLVAGPFVGMNPFKVDVGEALSHVLCPTLILHGRCDNLALPTEADRNFAMLTGEKSIVWFDNCGHSEFRWVQSGRYYQALGTFIDSLNLQESATKELTKT